jgi:hypothetical protein
MLCASCRKVKQGEEKQHNWLALQEPGFNLLHPAH